MQTHGRVLTARRAPDPVSDGRDDRSLEVVVLYTTTEATLRSLKTAAELAAGLAAYIRLLVLEVVPYPLPLDEPQASVNFTQRRFRTVAAEARISTRVDIRLGRDKRQMLESALNPRSLVVVPGGRGWWPTVEKRLAKRLQRLGHQVVLAA